MKTSAIVSTVTLLIFGVLPPIVRNKIPTLTFVNGSKALLENPTCKCAKGGEISFFGTGENSNC